MHRLASATAAAALAVYAASGGGDLCHLRVDPAAGSDAAAAAAFAAVGLAALLPWRTVGAARDALRGLPRPLPLGGLRVCLAPGRYGAADALQLEGAQDSGDGPDRRIVWSGAPGAPAEFSAGVHVVFSPPGPGSAVPGAWSAHLPDFGVTDVGAWTPHGFLQPGGLCPAAPLELFADGLAGALPYGTPLTPARWPNVAPPGAAAGGAFPEWAAEASWSRAQFVRGAPDTRDSALFVSADAPFANWSAATLNSTGSGLGATWTGYPFYDWADGSALLYGFDGATRTLALQREQLRYNVSFSAKYFVQNAREAMDAPGEYWVDAAGSTLYLLPPPGGVNSGWVTNASATLLSAVGVRHVAFAGLALSFTRGEAVFFANCADVTLVNVTIMSPGTSGVMVQNCTDTTVAGVNVSHAGGTGVDVWGGGSRATLAPSGNAVVDCTVAHVGRRCLSYAPAISANAVAAVVAHNDISGTPHIAAVSGQNDGVLEFNRLIDTVLAGCDMGAVYTGTSDWSVWNNSVRYNLFARTGFSSAGCNMQSGNDLVDVYFDQSKSGGNAEGNVHWSPLPPHAHSFLSRPRETFGYLFNGGSNMAVSNALLIDTNVSFFQTIDSLDAAGYALYCAPNSTFLAGMRAVRWNAGIYAARYPTLAALRDGCDAGASACAADRACPASPYGNAFVTTANVNVTSHGGQVVRLGHNASVFNPANFNFSGQWVGDDPVFAAGSPAAAKASLDFQLEDGSPVYAALPDFKRIPMECIGAWACPDEPAPYPRAARLRL